jgi:hypothetical protein
LGRLSGFIGAGRKGDSGQNRNVLEGPLERKEGSKRFDNIVLTRVQNIVEGFMIFWKVETNREYILRIKVISCVKQLEKCYYRIDFFFLLFF